MSSHWDEPPQIREAHPFGMLGTSVGETAWHAGQTEEVEIELIGAALRASGTIEKRAAIRFSDFVNMLEGFFRLRDVTLLDRTGKPTRIVLPDLRVRLDDIVLVAQKISAEPPPAPEHGYVAKHARRLMMMTGAHIVYGSVWMHEDASVVGFVDSTDPRWLPMTDVRVRWLADRRLAGRYPFALVQRSRIIAVTTEERKREAAAPSDVSY